MNGNSAVYSCKNCELTELSTYLISSKYNDFIDIKINFYDYLLFCLIFYDFYICAYNTINE